MRPTQRVYALTERMGRIIVRRSFVTTDIAPCDRSPAGAETGTGSVHESTVTGAARQAPSDNPLTETKEGSEHV